MSTSQRKGGGKLRHRVHFLLQFSCPVLSFNSGLGRCRMPPPVPIPFPESAPRAGASPPAWLGVLERKASARPSPPCLTWKTEFTWRRQVPLQGGRDTYTSEQVGGFISGTQQPPSGIFGAGAVRRGKRTWPVPWTARMSVTHLNGNSAGSLRTPALLQYTH